MTSFEITLKFDHPVKYPQLIWYEDKEPEELDLLGQVKNYAKKNNLSLDFIENNAVIFVEEFDLDKEIFEEPDIFQIDFSKIA
jgi:exopolysaccharide biosynthesis predicted pyruvyltransferase EpsI